MKNTYKIVHKIAMGGQGTAYLASVGDFSIKNKSSPNKQVHSDTERRSGGEAMDSGEAPNTTPEQIVLKEYVLPTQVGSRAKSQSIETLRNEAEILEKLEHKNIVKFLEYFVQDHRGYLVLEHINGKNLREIIKEKGPLEEKEILSLALQMCEMLSYLHSQNPQIIHRDFTPDNLILTDANELKLIDFNVARQNTSTVTATVVGKHSYISLEQFRGKATTQSDIYALGCILHFLSTGQDPEPLTSSSPILLNNDLSPQFNSIVERCTELDSELRYANTAELQKDLAEKFAGTDKIISKIAGTEGMDKIAAADKIADEAS